MAIRFATILLVYLFLCSSSLTQTRAFTRNDIILEENTETVVANDQIATSFPGKGQAKYLIQRICNNPYLIPPPICYYIPGYQPPATGHHHARHHTHHRHRGGGDNQICESLTHLLESCGVDFYTHADARSSCCRDVRAITGDCLRRDLNHDTRELLSVIKKICSHFDSGSPPGAPKSPPASSSPPKAEQPPSTPSSPPASKQPPAPPSSPPAWEKPPASSSPPTAEQPPASSSPPSQPPASPTKSPPPQPPSSPKHLPAPPKSPSPPKQTPPLPSPPVQTPPAAAPPPPKSPSSPPKSSPPPQTPSPPKPAPPAQTPSQSHPSPSSPSPTPPSTPNPTPHGKRPANCLVSTVLYDSCDPKNPEASSNGSSDERNYNPENVSTGFITDGAGCCLGFAMFTNDCNAGIKDLSFANQKVFDNLQRACSSPLNKP